MSFRTSSSGLDAAIRLLSVRSNNIANVGTTAFKKSEINFQDLVSTGSPTIKAGSRLGTQEGHIRQNFSQGALIGSNNALDLAVDGSGYFVVIEPGADLGGGRDAGVPYRYTRNGRFSLNRDGYIVDSRGRFLLGEASPDLDRTGNEPLRVDLTGKARATTDIQIRFKLDDRDPPAEVAADGSTAPLTFDRLNSSTYNGSLPFYVFDSLGQRHDGAIYLSKTRNASTTQPTAEWQPRVFIGDKEIFPTKPTTLEFDSAGRLLAGGYQQFQSHNLGNGAAPLQLSFFLGAESQPGGKFSVDKLYQNGYPASTVQTIKVDSTGMVKVSFDSGFETTAGRLWLATPHTSDALTQLGDGLYAETPNSPRRNLSVGFADENKFGKVLGGTLEASNVDLTSELIMLIEAQRSFQSNAKALESNSKMIDSLVRQ